MALEDVSVEFAVHAFFQAVDSAGNIRRAADRPVSFAPLGLRAVSGGRSGGLGSPQPFPV